MLHIMFRGNHLRGSGEEYFLSVLPYMGMAAILVICLGPRLFSFISLPGGVIRNLNETGPIVSAAKTFENVDRQMTLDCLTRSPNDLDL